MNRKNERGFILLSTMFVAVLIASIASVAMTRSRSLQQDTVLERGRFEARFAAEGGIAHARADLARGAKPGSARLRVGDSDVAVRVEALHADPARYRLRSVATTWPSGRNSLPVRVRIEALVDARLEILTWRER